jgi:hypothetical protein
MYCLSNALTVCQSSAKSLAMSAELGDAARDGPTGLGTEQHRRNAAQRRASQLYDASRLPL